MIREHDRIVLTEDLSEARLEAGDVGTVVHVHVGRRAYEVEFMTLGGISVAVVTVEACQVRRVGSKEIAHVRELVAV